MANSFSILWGTRRINAASLNSYMSSTMKHLKCKGYKPGDRIAICADNSVEYLILIFVLWQMGLIVCPISPRLPAKTVASYASRLGARSLLRSVDMKALISFDACHDLPPLQFQDLNLEQEVSIIASSGSSGEPKAVVHTWGNHYYNAQGSQELIPLTPSDSWLLALPLYHVSGLAILVRCFLAQASVFVLAEGDLATAIKKVTHVSLVATQLQALLNDETNHESLRRLKYILLGGSAISSSLIEQSLQLGLPIYLSYGLTEMASQVATGKVEKLGQACARVLAHRELKISAEGEILVKGKVLLKGYVVGTKLHLPLQDDGWFATGDLGSLDAQGYLTVTGRRDNMFISGGENIQPEEIEKVLLQMDGIIDAMIVPKEDQEFGQRPVAFIKFKDTALSSQSIIQYLEKELPRFKIPVAFYPWPQDLLSQGIKVSRQDFLKRF